MYPIIPEYLIGHILLTMYGCHEDEKNTALCLYDLQTK